MFVQQEMFIEEMIVSEKHKLRLEKKIIKGVRDILKIYIK